MNREEQRLAQQTMAFVLAGGRGSRLYELTDRRAKPAMYFGGKSRIIDFPLSNAVNSGIRRIGVATQYKAHSLIRHLQRGWSFFRAERNESLDILPASQQMNDENWYKGTADAVAQNKDIIEGYGPKYIIILAGDHIYKQDYAEMIRHHVESGADVTVGCIEVPRMEASGFGVMKVDTEDRILDFIEKPGDPPAMPGHPDQALASMGIYVFETEYLFKIMEECAAVPGYSHDFGGDIIPTIVRGGKAVAHPFSRSCVRTVNEEAPYWRDVGTVDAFWQANLDLTDFKPALDLYDTEWPIWTYSELTAPAKFIHNEEGRRGSAVSSMVSGGCIISGSSLERCLLFTGVRTHSFSQLNGVVSMPYAIINRNARLTNVVVDRGVVIPQGLVVGEDPALDAQRFRRTDSGVCLITQPMIDKLDM
ncbi:glucose-1-phosphate adenylyltransferase [Roseobacter denitrificans]|uniref:Glucose-1-phosphate adenylyltransferase n=1 Tax=Roseobacter denitrificans (strain ATCC 33942 / OCh 114) TaxID=375451 RepID=GLGC_ROSDO|nr:glucose-1-phosphate adenylyltransferase [Roseobacter denitrificans]Q165E3.1 RecName: Full=Glucose-1-phosphate adenylyltransferase; AltName: Full=ADP-glucose pyrophosphorylase; Short=ADPGlc PPase; AltName: Full=ADP-glucose synthase [Roseobacter denitrificans OCh 114]ABG32400.1 glucose-1-phosphate adenylyltransferase [Roseobacter denitrificans OCh 114]AVL51870.1 glucose-1-phosphate adenylyltransferase [Roseobacter denitrificans]SFF81311.1 glucose-1-phosphate adenylyltransferase [Roseobacter de